MLFLIEHQIIDHTEAKAIPQDAASAHCRAAFLPDGNTDYHSAAAALTEAIVEDGNWSA